MGSLRCYGSSNVIATLMMTNFNLNTTDVAIFPNVCLWRRSLCSDLVLTLKNCIEPPSYARTAYVIAIWPFISFRLFRKNLGNLRDFFGQMIYRPPLAKNFPYAYDFNLNTSSSSSTFLKAKCRQIIFFLFHARRLNYWVASLVKSFQV